MHINYLDIRKLEGQPNVINIELKIHVLAALICILLVLKFPYRWRPSWSVDLSISTFEIKEKSALSCQMSFHSDCQILYFVPNSLVGEAFRFRDRISNPITYGAPKKLHLAESRPFPKSVVRRHKCRVKLSRLTDQLHRTSQRKGRLEKCRVGRQKQQ